MVSPVCLAQSSLTSMGLYSLEGRPMQFKEKHLISGSDSTQPMTAASNCLLVTNAGPDGDEVILCDAGVGLLLDPQRRGNLGIPDQDFLAESLSSLGFDFGDISALILSHAHSDHVGGAYDQDMKMRFPNARIFMGQGAFNQSRLYNPEINKDPLARSYIAGVHRHLEELLGRGMLTLIEGDSSSLVGKGYIHEALGPDIRFYFSGGHLGEQMHVRLKTGARVFLFGGDMFPTLWHVEPAHYMPAFDKPGGEELSREKSVLLPRIVEEGWFICFYHDPAYVAAQVSQVDGLYQAANSISST